MAIEQGGSGLLTFLLALVTVLFFFVVSALFVGSMAFVGQRFGIVVEEVAIGVGPRLLSWNRRGIQYSIRLLPISSYTKFLNAENVHPYSHQSTNTYQAASKWVKILILLSGPFSNLALGTALLSIPVALATPQVVAPNPVEKEPLPPSLRQFEHLDTPSTYAGQDQFFRQTAGYYCPRLFTLGPLEGWGGLVAYFVTCGRVAQNSWADWLTLLAVLAIGNGVVNSLPVPVLNGGQILINLMEWTIGRELPAKALHVLQLCGLFLAVFIYIQVLRLDFLWIVRNLGLDLA
jgi:membrane-associated protease RseP (regulator of RpoE activity)